MKSIFALHLILAVAISANAQLHEKIVVKAGDNIPLAVSENGFYRLPKFTEGIYTMRNGQKATARFNFNIGNGEVEYIGDKGDTLAIGVPEEIRLITMGTDVQYIYKNKAYYEILADKKPGKLAKRVRILLENEKKGGYGESAPASSQSNLKNFTAAGGLYQLSYDIAIIKTTSFYWLDSWDNLQSATKKNSLKLVSKDKQAKLEAFIDENKISFNSEDDLRKLLQYADSL
jgi:hypothetical protein